MTPKIRYLIGAAVNSFVGGRFRCPSCGARDSRLIARKYLITTLRRCSSCHLLFRAPTTTATQAAAFYQGRYRQGFTTTMPAQSELADLIRREFRGTEKHYGKYLAVLDALGCPPGGSLLDFGCSWGYGSWQLARAGFRVSAVEIGADRCAYARDELGVDARETADGLVGPFDVFFSAHVLEHLPAVADAIRLARRVVRPGGWFVAFTPNGCEAFRRVNPKAWMLHWGLAHPNVLDDDFYAHSFPAEPRLIGSSPYDVGAIREWVSTGIAGPAELNLSGPELLFAAKLEAHEGAAHP